MTIAALRRQFQQELKKVNQDRQLEALRIRYLGRKGLLNRLFQQLAKLPPTQRRRRGQAINQLKNFFRQEIAARQDQLNQNLLTHLEKEKIDISLPGKKPKLGHLHPITLMKQEVANIFQRMGFEVIEAQEVNDDYHNFGALDIPADHPARDLWDTFWTREGFIPITHTSAMQNWIYRQRQPPIRVAVIGRCFRHEATDASHEHTFHQVEAVYVDHQVSVANLLATLKAFFNAFYHQELPLKIRPSYFPFVEPGLEIAIGCPFCHGRGCPVCQQSGWIEILGAGQIHPQVLKNGGLDPKKYRGFAWGLGLERLIMLRYQIEDIRHFHRGDLRFSQQFR